MLLPIVRVEAVANAIGFLLIALLVMAVANIIGAVMSKTLHRMGLGCLDRLAGGVFGFLQGALLVTLCILVIVAFFPKAHWLAEARLPKLFFRGMSPEHAREPGGSQRPCAPGSEDSWKSIARMDAPTERG